MPLSRGTVAASLRAGDASKIVSARDAMRLINDGDVIATSGFRGIDFAENIAVAIEALYLAPGEKDAHGFGRPRNLTLVYAAGQGDGKDRGLNHLGHEGLLTRVIGGHWGLVPRLQHLAMSSRIEAYNLPQGVITHLYRDIAAAKPRTLTRVGLGTFVDPRLSGGNLNERPMADLVRLMGIDGEGYLFYKTFPIDVGIIWSTTADPDGSVPMEKEALVLEGLSIAMAAHKSGGLVIANAERVAERGCIYLRQLVVPSTLVDAVVIAERP